MTAAVNLPLTWPATFAELVTASQGRHPLDLLEDLRRDPAEEARRLVREAERAPLIASSLAQGEGLALPHPLDTEWRFSRDTAEQLLERAIAATRPGDAILLLGVPTVALAAARSHVDRQFVITAEANIIGAGLAARVAGDPRFCMTPQTNCAAAVLDPPWYPGVFEGLVGLAASACQLGAVILLGAPSRRVRPTCDVERLAMLNSAAGAGLHCAEMEPEVLGYRTPAFEAAAMEAAGLRLWLPNWRRGDLLTMRKVGPGLLATLPTPAPAFELTLEGVRLRLLARPSGSTSLAVVAATEVFPSVSARTPGRDQANLWTSSNRAFACPPLATLSAMQQLAAEHGLWPKGLDPAGTDPSDSTSVDPIQLVSDLARIAARDLSHTAALVGETSWNRAANDARFLNGSEAMFHQALRGAAV